MRNASSSIGSIELPGANVLCGRFFKVLSQVRIGFNIFEEELCIYLALMSMKRENTATYWRCDTSSSTVKCDSV